MDHDDPLTLAFAETLALNPGMTERLLTLHVDDGRGLCAECTTVVTRTRWPCGIAWHTAHASDGLVKNAALALNAPRPDRDGEDGDAPTADRRRRRPERSPRPGLQRAPRPAPTGLT